MKPLIILKLGAPKPDIIARLGQYSDWIARTIAPAQHPVRVIDIIGGESLPAVNDTAGVILSGSAHMVPERQPWSEATRRWLQHAVPAGLPVFAICYGHQLLADACGGEVGDNPRGLEIGSATITRLPACDDDPIFAALPAHFTANVTHFQSVLCLPETATRLAANEHDPHQAYRIGAHAWGVQFHPEFDAAAIRAHIDGRRDVISAAGRDPDAISAAVCAEHPDAAALLLRFARYAAARSGII